MSLYIKHRANSFDEIVGNELVIESIKSILEKHKEELPHVWMFTGSFGLGKTTIGRIIAKELGAKGEDLIEVDAGKNRSVEDADRLKDGINYAPIESSAKVYILDEMQAVSSKFFDSLLKTLEDGCPNHVYFIICTTDPQKINGGILSRAMKFKLTKLTPREIIKLLKNILEKEGKELSSIVLRAIATQCSGVPRDALVMLEQVIDMEEEEKIIGLIQSYQTDEEKTLELIRALMQKKKWNIVSELLKGLEKEEPERVRRAIRTYCCKVMLNNGKETDQASVILDYTRNNLYYGDFAALVNSCYLSVTE